MIRVVTLPDKPKWKSPKAWIELVDDKGTVLATGRIYEPNPLTGEFVASDEHDPVLYGIYRMIQVYRFYKNVIVEVA